MSKSRIINAGSAGSTIYHCNVNLDTAGGNKKQGLPFSINTQYYNKPWIAIKATGNKRDYIFTMNQIGGVGHIDTLFVQPGGFKYRPPYKYVPPIYPLNTNESAKTPSKHLTREGGPSVNMYSHQRPTPIF